MKVILGNNWSGLGDHLQFSTLPELLASGGHEVYIHEGCSYRNDEIKDLVWRTNPYVKGFTHDAPNVGSVVVMRQHLPSIVANWEIAHFGKAFNKYPKIYYKPKIVERMRGKILLDTSAISDKYEDEKLRLALDNQLGDNTDVLQVTFAKSLGSSVYLPGKYNTYEVKSIFEYIDCIATCQRFICLMSGGAVAAAALEHMGLTPPTTVLMSVPKNIFKFDNLNYVEI
jgi:hypothetical protein